MKKLILTVAFGTLAAGANAQMRFGAEVGVQMANLVTTVPEYDINGNQIGTEHIDSRPNLGLRGGLVAQFSFTDNLSFQPAILFAMKGARLEETIDLFGTQVEIQQKINLNNIEVPLNFQYNTNSDGTGFFVGAGPYLAYAFAGKVVTQINDVEVEDRDVEFGDELTDDFKNLDVGVGLNLGYMLPMGAFVRGFGQYGFSNIFPEHIASADGKTRNYGFGLTVGYMIGGDN